MTPQEPPELARAAMAEAEAEHVAWEWFAGAHPHEAHAEWPDRFWKFFQGRCPGVTREQMERTLMKTDNDQAHPRRAEPLKARTTQRTNEN